jgi:gliding motility-associated-like protein
MLRFLLLTFIVLWSIFKVNGQENLVPNSSFEILECRIPGPCLTSGTPVYSAVQQIWQPNGSYVDYTNLKSITYNDGFGSPDLFCSFFNWYVLEGVSFYGVPYNRFGFNYPRTDSVYAGFSLFEGTPDSKFAYKEYIRVRLKEPLKKGYGYKAGLYWSLCDSCAASNKLAMNITVDSFLLSSQSQFIDVLSYPKPQIESQEIMRDTSGWNLFEGTFIAKGGELYLTIGNFAPEYELEREAPVNGFNQTGNPCQCIIWSTYFYIDDVFLYEYPEAGVPENEIKIPNIITPNGDGINDVFELTPYLPPGTGVTVYNRWGNEVFQSDNYQNNWAGITTFGAKANPGVYFYIIKFPQGLVKKGTLTIVYE